MIRLIVRKFFWGGLRHLLTDKAWHRWRYYIEFGFFPDLNQPNRLSEKIQQIKLTEQTDLRRLAADRLRVRDYIEQRAGREYLIPLYGCWGTLTHEAWDSLPDSFVLKATHGSGFVRVIRNKKEVPFSEIRNETDRWLSTDYYRFGREWVYKDLKPGLIAEELLLSSKAEIPADFKFFCFHGKVGFIQVDQDRFGEQRRNLYTSSFKKLDAELHHPAGVVDMGKPAQLEEAVKLAEKLAEPFTFIRVDLYLPGEKIYFGELTNYPGNGFERFCPDKWDFHFGELLSLSGFGSGSAN
ncbi:MAG: hypothetical protein EA360_03665 [Balneolaceae bacterium]|nr:MAG: hypothetical protein EA360_03665 [Balneolaceae bacterium]